MLQRSLDRNLPCSSGAHSLPPPLSIKFSQDNSILVENICYKCLTFEHTPPFGCTKAGIERIEEGHTGAEKGGEGPLREA